MKKCLICGADVAGAAAYCESDGEASFGPVFDELTNEASPPVTQPAFDIAPQLAVNAPRKGKNR